MTRKEILVKYNDVILNVSSEPYLIPLLREMSKFYFEIVEKHVSPLLTSGNPQHVQVLEYARERLIQFANQYKAFDYRKINRGIDSCYRWIESIGRVALAYQRCP